MRASLITLMALLTGLAAVPAAAQGIPDYIPDQPGESLVDREKDKLEEQLRPFLSRLFTTGTVEAGPLREGVGHQSTMSVGIRVAEDDALFVSLGLRGVPLRLVSARPTPGEDDARLYLAGGYELSGTRLGTSELAERSAVGVAVGAIFGDATLYALDVTPTYELVRTQRFSMPVGLRLSVASSWRGHTVASEKFVGLYLGVRWFWVTRDELELDRLD